MELLCFEAFYFELQVLGCSLAVFAPGWTHECTPDGMDIDEYDLGPRVTRPRLLLVTCNGLSCSCDAMLWTGHEWTPVHDATWSAGQCTRGVVFDLL